MNVEVPELLELLGAPTAAPAWPNSPPSPIDVSKRSAVNAKELDLQPSISPKTDIKSDYLFQVFWIETRSQLT